MLLIVDCAKKVSIPVLKEAHIVEVNSPMIAACYAYSMLCAEYGVHGVMTGAGGEEVYKNEPLHLKGYAWDFRSFIFPDPKGAARKFCTMLKDIDPRYRVVYIKLPKPPHFHVEFKAGG